MSQVAKLERTGGSPSIPLFFVTDTGTSEAFNDTLYVVGGAGVTTITTTTVGTNDTIEINVSATGFGWEVITSADNIKQIIPETGYICTGGILCTLLLPLTPTIGDTFKVFSYSARFQIIPNGSQFIVVGSVTGSSGAGGTLTSNSPGDQVTITYMGSNGFQAEAPQGILTLL